MLLVKEKKDKKEKKEQKEKGEGKKKKHAWFVSNVLSGKAGFICLV